MQKQAPSLGRILMMVLFALSCFGLLLFLWLSFGGPVPLKPKGYQVKVAFPEATQLGERGRRARGGRQRRQGAQQDARPQAAQPHGGDDRARRASSRRSPRTRARSCARRRCWARPTWSSRPATAPAGTVPDGGFLADARVAKTVELDEIFQALDPKTRASFRTWQQDLVQGGRRPRARPQRRASATCPRSPTTATTC